MCSARVSETMQYGAKARAAGINIYVTDIAVVRWRSSCNEIKYGNRRQRKREESAPARAIDAGKAGGSREKRGNGVIIAQHRRNVPRCIYLSIYLSSHHPILPNIQRNAAYPEGCPA